MPPPPPLHPRRRASQLYSPTPSTPPAKWSPTRTLHLPAPSTTPTCLALAPSTARRCHMPLSRAAIAAADAILRVQRLRVPQPVGNQRWMRELAQCLLCSRHARDERQVRALLGDWEADWGEGRRVSMARRRAERMRALGNGEEEWSEEMRWVVEFSARVVEGKGWDEEGDMWWGAEERGGERIQQEQQQQLGSRRRSAIKGGGAWAMLAWLGTSLLVLLLAGVFWVAAVALARGVEQWLGKYVQRHLQRHLPDRIRQPL